MQSALQLAQYAATQQEVPVGAVVILEDRIIGKGWNQPISQRDPCAHAEIIALRAAASSLSNYRLPNTTLYVTLEPCMMCAGAIVHARVKRVVFGAYDPKTSAMGSAFNLLADKRHNHIIEITGGILEQDCAAILQEFFRMRR